MTCQKVQSQIIPFINDELNIKELDDFIHHVESCPECREELEVYYALMTAMKQLDENETMSDDYNLELSAKLQKAEEKIVHSKFTYYRKKGILFMFIVIIGLFFSFRYGYMRYEEEKNQIVTESNYGLRFVYRSERFKVYDQALQNFMAYQVLLEELRANPIVPEDRDREIDENDLDNMDKED